jgi:hypothetical protein
MDSKVATRPPNVLLIALLLTTVLQACGAPGDTQPAAEASEPIGTLSEEVRIRWCHRSRCGDGSCDPGENCGTCRADCGRCSRCGNGICDTTETCTTCATDCGRCLGAACTADTQCSNRGGPGGAASAGHCVDGVCCDGACAGDCNACNTAAAPGRCTLLAETTTCRASQGGCDPAETCTGASPECPTDDRAASGTVCRAAAGACDRPEVCDGAEASCPSDALAAAGETCRAAGGACDLAESCTGESAACPDDGLAGGETVCRAAAGGCDAEEACSGTSVACPDDALLAAGAACGEPAPAPVTFSYLDDESDNVPADALAAFFQGQELAPTDYLFVEIAGPPGHGGAWCSARADWYREQYLSGAGTSASGAWRKWSRADEGPWSSATTASFPSRWGVAFDGDSRSWCAEEGLGGRTLVLTPGRTGADEAYLAGLGHGGAAGVRVTVRTGVKFNEVCLGEPPQGASCSGESSVCPPPPRCGNGVVDPGEQCDGGACCEPECRFVAADTICRAASGACDVAEVCSGAAAACPADAVAAAGLECRAADGDCDLAESCDGLGADCPADGFAPAGASCTVVPEAHVLSFSDGPGDDVPATAVFDFFAAKPLSRTDYLYFGISGAPAAGAWCAERADWYRDYYLAYATSGILVDSGGWRRWTRLPGEGWLGPETGPHNNYFGRNCDGAPYSWCSEYNIASRYLAVMPGRVGGNEAWASGPSGGAGWGLTIRSGNTFDVACNGLPPAPVASACSGASAHCPAP